MKQGRAPSPGSGSQSDGPCMSRSGSMASQQAPERASLPECNVIRRTKRQDSVLLGTFRETLPSTSLHDIRATQARSQIVAAGAAIEG